MELIEAYKTLLDLKIQTFLTGDAAAAWKTGKEHAGAMLSRLSKKKLILRLIRGRYALSKDINPLTIPQILVRPYESYISLQTALYLHGMISQIPAVYYVATLDRTKNIKTPFGTYGFHHISPSFFFGFSFEKNVLMASPEKALLDFFYCYPAKSGLFKRLPELEFPEAFDFNLAWSYIDRIESPMRKTLVKNQFKEAMKRVNL